MRFIRWERLDVHVGRIAKAGRFNDEPKGDHESNEDGVSDSHDPRLRQMDAAKRSRG